MGMNSKQKQTIIFEKPVGSLLFFFVVASSLHCS